MLTNQRDAFRSQSRSPDIAPFHMLDIVSCRAIVTLSLRRAVFLIFDFENAVTLKTGLGVRQVHWKCHQAIERLDFLLMFYITMDQQINIRRCITQRYSNHKVHLSLSLLNTVYKLSCMLRYFIN